MTCSTCDEVIETDKWVFIDCIFESCQMLDEIDSESNLSDTTNYFNYFNQDAFLKTKYARYKCPVCGTESIFEDRRRDQR